MSGTFEDITVPPTVVAFGVNTIDSRHVTSVEFKEIGSKVVLIPLERDGKDMPNFQQLNENYLKINAFIREGKVLAACSIKAGGLAETISKMCFGNKIGFKFNGAQYNKVHDNMADLFIPAYGSIVLEMMDCFDCKKMLKGIEYKEIGSTIEEECIIIGEEKFNLNSLINCWERTLGDVFPVKATPIPGPDLKVRPEKISFIKRNTNNKTSITIGKPRVFIPILPGTIGELEAKRAFEEAGGIVNTFVFRSLSLEHIKESFWKIKEEINDSQIIMLLGGNRGGFQTGDPGKYLTSIFKNPAIEEAVMDLLGEREGLILGVGSGFQTLLKLGLLPYGKYTAPTKDSPILTVNSIGRTVSKLVSVRIASTLSPWHSNVKVNDTFLMPFSHGEGKFVAKEEDIDILAGNGQIAAQYVDTNNNPSLDERYNPSGSLHAIESITSKDGRIMGKTGYPERIGPGVAINVPGNKEQKIFKGGIDYFK